MTCEGTCTLCGNPRDSRDCHCFSRSRINDPFHPVFSEAESFIRDTTFYGWDAHETALVLIASARQDFISDYAGKNIRHTDGWDVKRIDEQAVRLARRSSGRVYATKMKLDERPKKQTDDAMNHLRIASNLDRLARIK